MTRADILTKYDTQLGFGTSSPRKRL